MVMGEWVGVHSACGCCHCHKAESSLRMMSDYVLVDLAWTVRRSL